MDRAQKYFGLPSEVSKDKFELYLAERPRQRALYRILTAYSNYPQRKLDYCQGMNYIGRWCVLSCCAVWSVCCVLLSIDML